MNIPRIPRLVPALAATVGLALCGSALAHPGAGFGGGGFHGGGGVHAGAHFAGGGAHYGGYHGGGYYGGYRGGWHGGWRGGGYYRGWGYFGAGLFLASLPFYYSTYYWDGIPYYYVDNNYYRWNASVAQYEAVRPPVTTAQSSAPQPAATTELFMYPKAGQSAEQQARDKYECHRWAADQTAFDPTQAASGTQPDAAAKRADYLRADGACLEGRNYSVR